MAELDDDDILTEEDRQAVIASRHYFRLNPDGGVLFERLVEECGFTIDEVDGCTNDG
jgi:hypothetical protein